MAGRQPGPKGGAGGQDKEDGKEQFEFSYPSKLKPLFEEDAEDEEYEVPFRETSELMDILSELEEQNLKLIQQGQEMEQTIEARRRKQVNDKYREDGELEKLEKREKEVTERTKKTQDEKMKLENQSAGDSSKMMNDEEVIKKRI